MFNKRSHTMKRIAIYALLAFFSITLIVGCADFFAPGMREAVKTVETNVAEVAQEQGVITSLVKDGQTALQSRLDEMRAGIETMAFRTEEDRTGVEAMFASYQSDLDKFGGAVTEVTSGLDEKIATYYTQAQKVAADFEEADTPSAALSVFGEMLLPFLGPYAPVGEIGLSLLGLFGAGRTVNKRAKTNGATSVLAPIERARDRDLEAKLTSEDAAGRKFVVFDTLRTQPVFDANGAGAIIESFKGLADKKAA